ncbi:ferritin-like domain-containing protein [Neisseria chenwenguii]|uniref:Bacterioferritin n=1 Tax=Neisseria chenwenguii TaxID=1853278 RepID=A0A220RZA9_9NEIS|nr:ferritin-like domain-containing protein [Neisseria chenwenguii]ASK26561.1 bacterioferritin [Neisseria chenwenguii]ROV56004.1 bacterioferritin [Neisseria chenwenguii]
MKNVQQTIQFLQSLATDLAANAISHKIVSKNFAAQGFTKLAEKYAAHYAEEMAFVDQFYDRILDLDGEIKHEAAPSFQTPTDVEAYFQYDLQQSVDGLPVLEEAINAGFFDITTLDLMKEYYKDEEEDLNWTKAQLDLIALIGKQNYLATMI